MLSDEDKGEIIRIVEERLKLNFTDRRIGDTPTDAYQLVPRKYVDENVLRILPVKCCSDATSVSAGDDFFDFFVPPELDGARITAVAAAVTTPSSSGGPITINIRNGSSDILSTALTINDSEYTSTTATPAVINTANAVVSKVTMLHIDIDDAGSGARGLQVSLTFSLN